MQLKGMAGGTDVSGDHFGFVAEEIGSFQVGGRKLSLTRGARNDLAGMVLGSTEDVTVRKIR